MSFPIGLDVPMPDVESDYSSEDEAELTPTSIDVIKDIWGKIEHSYESGEDGFSTASISRSNSIDSFEEEEISTQEPSIERPQQTDLKKLFKRSSGTHIHGTFPPGRMIIPLYTTPT